MKKYYILILLVLMLFTTEVKAEDFEINHADSLEVINEQISISGNIKIKFKDALIEAPNGLIETSKGGKPSKATFSNRAIIKIKDRKLEADELTVLLDEKLIIATGNVISELKDKKSNLIKISSTKQELHWNGEDALASGNTKTSYQETTITSEEVRVLYKNKKPNLAIFSSQEKEAKLEQPGTTISAQKLIFDINTQDIKAENNVHGAIWSDKTKTKENQSPIIFTSDELYINNEDLTVKGKSKSQNQVNITHEEVNGKSNEAILFREKGSGKPQKLLFNGKANVKQGDKELSSEEIVFNILEKKLFSNTINSKRPKTTFFKKTSL